MKKPFVILFACVMILASCKKDKSSSTTASSTSSTPAITKTSNSNTSPFAVLISTVACNGFLSINYYARVTPVSYSTREAQASFYKTGIPYPGSDLLAVKSLSLNGDSMGFAYDGNNSPMYYWKGSLTDNLKETWDVNGTSEIPSFTYTDDMPPPSADFSKVPDTLKMSEAILNINTLSNATSAFLLLSAYGESGQNLQVNLGIGNNTIQISADDLKKLQMSTKGLQLFVSIENVTYKNFGGKNFKFSKTYGYERQIIVIP